MAPEKTRAAPHRPVLTLLAVTLCFALLATGLGLVLGTPGGHSLKFNLAWHEAFSALFWQGQPYPRYLPDLWYGLGGLDLFFYGPLPFWLSALLAPLCAGCTASTQLAMAGAVLWTASIPAFWIFAPVVASLEARDLAIWQAPIVLGEIARAAVPVGIDAVTAIPRGHAITLDGSAEVILPVPYWHRFRAEDASGTQLQLAATEPYGMTAITVPDPTPGQTITLTVPRLAVEWAGLALGLAGLAGLAMFLLYRRRHQPRPTPQFQEGPR